MEELSYLNGFGNHFATEALDNVLPQGQNSPQKIAHGLFAEQINGTAFTVPRHSNKRSWLYRIRPSVMQGDFVAYGKKHQLTQAVANPPPNQMRWAPIDIPQQKTTFIEGLISLADNKEAAAIHYYACNQSMEKEFFYDADGELLIVPQQGALRFKTELGRLDVQPNEIVVIPRGMKFQVELLDESARGYICENRGQALQLPELGPIGANGLANPRDFCYPQAWYEHVSGNYQLICKFNHSLWQAELDHSPLDVVAWHGNYAPYKYNLKHFNTINTVSFDHPDPSIYTVLTSPSHRPGEANIDFVIFPDRWMVAEHTFRPPYFHRNLMSEFMGLIQGVYDAKQDEFAPGGFSLHNCFSAHGPDSKTYQKATTAELKPQRYRNTLAFMFESNHIWCPTQFALDCPQRDRRYLACWDDLPVEFGN